jgi:hypothetical protein
VEAFDSTSCDRLASIERKLDGVLNSGTGVASATSNPAIRDLALAIGQDRVLLPLSVIISRRFTVDGEEIATPSRSVI